MSTSRRFRTTRRRRRNLFFEPLEARRLLAFTVTWGAGVLTVNGTGGDDHIAITSDNINGTHYVVVEGDSPDWSGLTNAPLGAPATTAAVTGITINGLAGEDFISVLHASPKYGFAGLDNQITIDAGPGDDIVLGGLFVDEIYGREGFDTISGFGGGDILDGGTDSENQVDTIDGGSGNDHITGGGGDDILRGDEDIDHIHGGPGKDTIYGGTETDYLYGEEGVDTIYGEDGDDWIYIGTGDPNDDIAVETARGGPGNDRMFGQVGGSGGNFFGDDGDDIIKALGGVTTYDLTGFPNGEPAEIPSNHVFGGMGIDTITGSDNMDLLEGGPNNDTIDGGGGKDEILGDDGDDVLNGGNDGDTIDGGTGNDTIDGGDGPDVIDGGGDQPYNGVGGNPAFRDVKGTGDPGDGDCDLENGHPDIECEGIEVSASIDPEPSDEADAVTLSGTIDDPYPNGIYDIIIDWGDGASDTQDDVTAYAFTKGHTYADDGTYVVQVTVTDISDRQDDVSFTHIVNNMPPVPVMSGSGGPEGSAITLTGSATDPAGAYDTITLDWTVTKGGFAYASGSGSSFTFTPNDNGNYLATLTAADEDGGSASVSTSLAVTNVAPALATSVSTSVIDEGSSITLTGTYTDPGSADTHMVTIDWGDVVNGTPIIDTFSVSGGNFSRTYTYQDDGPGAFADGFPGNGTLSDDYTIDVTIIDDDGGGDSGPQTITVNNVDPVVTLSASGSFVITLDVTIEDTAADFPSYQIDWGDGFSESYPHHYFFNYQFDHSYMMDGTYTIDVTITDDDGGTGSALTDVTVSTMGGWTFLTLDDPRVSPPSQPDAAITIDAVNAILPHAVEYWQRSGVEFQGVDIRIVDLPDQRLAAANPATGTILVDKDAAGYGWFVDASDSAAAMAGRVDLFSALSHEVGHLLGHQHEDQDHRVMGEYLSVGIRSVEKADDLQPSLIDRAVGDLFSGSALLLGTRRGGSAMRSDFFQGDLLTPAKSDSSNRKRDIAPLVREVVDHKLLEDDRTTTSDSGSGADDELDLLLGGDAELRMDVETGELTGILS